MNDNSNNTPVEESIDSLNTNPTQYNEVFVKDDIAPEIKLVKGASKIYKVEIKNILASFLSCRAFSFATKQERAVGIPVVVRAMQIIKKLKII